MFAQPSNLANYLMPMLLGGAAGAAAFYIYRKWKERLADARYWGQPFEGIDMLCIIGAQHEVQID
jgi:hypothetical protein